MAQYGGGSATKTNCAARPSLFLVLLLKSLLSSSVTVYCSCECAYLLRLLFIVSYTSKVNAGISARNLLLILSLPN